MKAFAWDAQVERDRGKEWEFVIIEPIKDAFTSGLFMANRLGRMDFHVECFCGLAIPIRSTSLVSKCRCGGVVEKVVDAETDGLKLLVSAYVGGVKLINLSPVREVIDYAF